MILSFKFNPEIHNSMTLGLGYMMPMLIVTNNA